MQRFQMIARRVNQIREQAGCVDRPEFAESGPLNRTVAFAALAMENAFRFSITKTFDHTFSVSRRTLYNLNAFQTFNPHVTGSPGDESF
jgi:hypothetical protein